MFPFRSNTLYPQLNMCKRANKQHRIQPNRMFPEHHQFFAAGRHSRRPRPSESQHDKGETEDSAPGPIAELVRQVLQCVEDQKRKRGLPSRLLNGQSEQWRVLFIWHCIVPSHHIPPALLPRYSPLHSFGSAIARTGLGAREAGIH